MTVNRKEVFIFKSNSDDDDKISYEKLMIEAGLIPKLIPTIDFEYCNADCIKNSLMRPCNFSGIIFTSPRSVRAVVKSLGSPEVLPAEWRDLPMFVVGEATKRVLNNELGIKGQSGVTENAVGLAEVIARRTYKQPLLFPCSDIRRDTLPALMLEKRIPLKEIIAYYTHQHPLLEPTLMEATAQGSTCPEFVLFFSPSGVKYSLPILEKMKFPVDKTKIVVIGTTTCAAAQEIGMKVWSCATRPNPQQILNAIIDTP